ncbi:MAG: excisionase family DNA-binding protein [Pseudomonadota bacterium]
MNAYGSIAKPLDDSADAARERDSADQLRSVLAASRGQSIGLVSADGDRADVTLNPAMTDLLLNVLRIFSSGDAVVLMPLGKQLTTQQAADILNVSRPYFIKLLESGALPFDKVGRHRRMKFEDVLAYKNHRDDERSRALDDLAEIGGDIY